jgi:hypothetical protein
MQIAFAPQTSGAKNATVNFIDNASGSPQSISLAGTAIAPALQISSASLTFAAQSVGTASPSQTITLSSTGTSSATINGITITGANANDFSENGNCSSVLGAGASCQIIVIFKPLAAGNRSASISISDNAAGNPHSVSLTGTATQAAVSLSPSTLNFANQLVGTASAPLALTVTNTGTGALVIGSISFSGTNPADFILKNTCTGPITPSATCLINVTFTPTAVGPRTATMVLADNASNAPQSIPLTGAAMNFVIDPPNIGATSATITAGQTATYQLALQSIDGFAGPVTLTCTGAPAGATCTAIPTPVTLTANATAPFQVQVTTTARTASANLVSPQTPQAPHPPITTWRITTLPIVTLPITTFPNTTLANTTLPVTTLPILLALLSIALSTAIHTIPAPLIPSHHRLLASQPIRPCQQTNHHELTANLRKTTKQKFSKHVTPRIAIAATLEIALILSMLSCGTKTPPTFQSGTPANTYTLTLSPSTPGGPPPTTQPLTLTIQ